MRTHHDAFLSAEHCAIVRASGRPRFRNWYRTLSISLDLQGDVKGTAIFQIAVPFLVSTREDNSAVRDDIHSPSRFEKLFDCRVPVFGQLEILNLVVSRPVA